MTDLTIEVKALTDEARKGFADLGKQIGDLNKKAKDFSKEGSTAFESFKGTLSAIGVMKGFGLIKDGFGEVVNYMKESVKESAKAEDALNQLNLSFALAGKYSKATTEEFVKFAEGLQNTTKYEDDTIIKNAALLESFAKLDKDGLKRATKAALDLSAATGKSLEESFGLLEKASIGATERLGQAGIVIKKTGNAATDFNLVLDEINKQFGGSAEAQVMTYSGAMAQLENVYGNFKEALGDIITKNPLAIAGIKALKDMFVILTKIVTDNKDSLVALIGQGFQQLISLIPTIAKGIGFLTESFASFLNIQELLFLSTSKLKVAFLELGNLKLKADVFTAFGADKKRAEDALKLNQDQIKEEKNLQIVYAKGADDRTATAKKVSLALEGFAKESQVALNKRYEESKKASNSETDNFLSNLSKKNEGAKAADKNEVERIKAREKLIEENRKTALAYMEQDKAMRENIAKQTQDLLGAGLGAFDPSRAKKIEEDRSLNEEERKAFRRNQAIGGGLGIAGAVLGGEGGAQSLVVGGAKAIADIIMPGLGQAVGPILDALSKGPDAVKGFIKDFVKSVPILVTNIAKAMPAVIEALIEELPVLIDSLISAIPEIINALVFQLPVLINKLALQMPFIALNLISSLVQQTPLIIQSLVQQVPQMAWEFIKSLVTFIPNFISAMVSALWDGIKSIFDNLNPFSGGGGGGGSDWYNPTTWFAQGGMVKKVPSGFPNDSFPARLSEGELVVDRSTSGKLETFLNSQNNNSDILIRILDAVSSPITVESSVQVNQSTFANIILELSRQNRRLAI